jgi:hypothetical protein
VRDEKSLTDGDKKINLKQQKDIVVVGKYKISIVTLIFFGVAALEL